MTFYILDPNLNGTGGHHQDWDVAIAEVAVKRDENVVIFANKAAPPSETGRISIVPWFSHSCYEIRSEAPYTKAFDDFRYFNDSLADELAALSHSRFTALDCVLAPTLNENHLLGYVSWMKTFHPLTAPLFVLHLMFPSGLSLSDEGLPRIEEPQQALFYALGFQKAREPGPTIHIFGGGRQIAREFSELSGTRVEPHPIPWRAARRLPTTVPAQPRVLLFAGDAKAEKGFALVPDIVETLAADYPDWTFLVHANETTAWDETRAAFDRLVDMAARLPNLELKAGRLPRADYEQLLHRAHGMISTYDPLHYARKSSSVVWEAISLGLALLAPAGTWISKEAEDWGAGVVAYPAHTVAAICEGFREFAANLGDLMKRSRAAATIFRARNGPDAVFNQFSDLWAARWMAAKLVGSPALRSLPLSEQRGDGLYQIEGFDGAAVRWTGLEFDLSFDWDFADPWELTLTAPIYIGDEQILGARAQSADGAPLLVLTAIENKIGQIIVVGAPTGAADSGVTTVNISLPWTYRPEGEVRELGILLRDLSVGPSSRLPSASFEDGIRILTPGYEKRQGDCLSLNGLISGAVALEPSQDAKFSMSLQTQGGVEALRATELFVNGTHVPLCLIGVERDLWRASAEISKNILIRGGYSTSWDLVNARADAHEVLLRQISFVQTGRVRQRQMEASSLPAAPPLAPAPKGDAVIVGKVVLDDYIPAPSEYCHVGLSIFNVSEGRDSWDHIKFNLCRFRGASYLEFREKADWPTVFRTWPGENADRFGPYVKFPDPSAEGMFPVVTDVRDLSTIRMVFANLSTIVRSCESAEWSEADRLAWADEATRLSRRFAEARPDAATAGSAMPVVEPARELEVET